MDLRTLKKQRKNTMQAAIERKEYADRIWERVYSEATNGSISAEKLYIAMDQCNRADWQLIHERWLAQKYSIGNK